MSEQNLTGYPSIDKPWLKYYSEEALQMSACENTVYELIYSKNSTHLSDVTMEYFGRKITYKTLFKNVEKVKKSFLANGVKKGDRVIMFTSATPELVYVVLALCRIGAVVNMINPVFTLEQIKARINETDAEISIPIDAKKSVISCDIEKEQAYYKKLEKNYKRFDNQLDSISELKDALGELYKEFGHTEVTQKLSEILDEYILIQQREKLECYNREKQP